MTGAREYGRRTWIVARRDLKALFDHPTGYVLLVVFVAVNAFLFFRQVYLVGVASLRPMLELLPWILLFFVPAVTMRSVAEDARAGLLETVLAQPLTELEWLAGKYIGATLFLWTGLALTLPIPLALSLGAHMQWGPVVAQYVGAALLVAGLTGVGVWASSIARSQVTAFILAVAVMFVLVLVGLDPLIVGLPPALAAVAAQAGVLSHFESTGRGVIDLRDVVYFLALAGVFLDLAYGSLVRRRLSSTGAAARRLRTGVALVAVTWIVASVASGYINLRLDLTPNRAYTLSNATKQIAGNLDDIVTIKVFASDELPTSAALLEREVNDLLRDLRAAGHGKIRVTRRDPTKDETARSDAQALGIGPIQFNVVGQSELQVKQGYLGLAVQYGKGTETIPFIDRTDDLEYRLVSDIRSLTRTKKPVVGLIADPRNPDSDMSSVRSELAKSYDVRSIALSDTTQPAADVKTLIVAGASDPAVSGATPRLQAFFHRGGNALILASAMQVPQQVPVASEQPVTWNPLLAPFGVQVHNDMVYDLASNEPVPVPTDFGVRVLRPYPFFVRAQTTGKSVVNRDLNSLLLPWPSSIDTGNTRVYTITPLLTTSRGGGAVTGETTIDPSRDFPQDNLHRRVLAVQVEPKPRGDSTAHGRVIVVGSTDFVADNFARGVPDNVAFTLNAIDWLSQDESLIGIRAKDARPPSLAFTSAVTRDGVKYLNTIGVPALIALAGLLHLARRRQRSREPYRGASAQHGNHITGAAA